jgi:hypothetical protein
MGKLYLPAVRSDKEEFGVTHLDILGAAAPGMPRVAKEGSPCINACRARLSPMLPATGRALLRVSPPGSLVPLTNEIAKNREHFTMGAEAI